MNDLEQKVTEYWMTELPNRTFLGSSLQGQSLSNEHQDQIHFLTSEGTIFIKSWINSSKMFSNMLHLGETPFNPEYFKFIQRLHLSLDAEKKIKKWLYSKQIPFDKYVFIDSDRSGHAVMATWKMVIKYWEGLFFAEDVIIVDSSFTWGLFYFHEGEIFFGEDVIYARDKEEQRALELNNSIKEWYSKMNPPT